MAVEYRHLWFREFIEDFGRVPNIEEALNYICLERYVPGARDFNATWLIFQRKSGSGLQKFILKRSVRDR